MCNVLFEQRSMLKKFVKKFFFCSGESQARHSFPTSSSEAIPSLPNPSKVEHVFPTHPSGVDQSFLTPRSGVAQSVPNHSRVLTPLSTPSSESIPSRSTSSSGVLNPLPILHRPGEYDYIRVHLGEMILGIGGGEGEGRSTESFS